MSLRPTAAESPHCLAHCQSGPCKASPNTSLTSEHISSPAAGDKLTVEPKGTGSRKWDVILRNEELSLRQAWWMEANLCNE